MATNQTENGTNGLKKDLPWIILAAVILIVGLIVAGMLMLQSTQTTNTETPVATASPLPSETENADAAVTPTATDYVSIEIANYGTITAELYGNVAPITVENFMKLVDEGFYDGLTFHRIISGFMIQGGDPRGNGTGGSDQTIKGEFSSNGVDNPINHVRGVLSMARSSNPDSASSQFFIMHADAPHLDGDYAAFGKVLTGMEVVDAICQNTPVQDSNGTVAPADQPVITRITRIDPPAN